MKLDTFSEAALRQLHASGVDELTATGVLLKAGADRMLAGEGPPGAVAGNILYMEGVQLAGRLEGQRL